MNNKGFAISAMLYSILILLVVLVVGIMLMLSGRKIAVNKIKDEVISELSEQEVAYSENSYLKNGLVLWYDGIINTRMINNNEIPNTTINDLSGNNNHGTLVNFDFNQDSGWINNYLKLDGDDDYVDTGIFGAEQFDHQSDFTMSIYLKVNRVTAIGNEHGESDASTIFGATNFNGYGIIWRTIDGYESKYNLFTMMRTSHPSGHALRSTSIDNETNNFDVQHLTFVYSSSQQKQTLYVNGQKFGEGEVVNEGPFALPSQMGNIQIGGNDLYTGSSRNVYTDMNVYSAKIYDRALSDLEVNYNYNIDKYRYGF